MAAICFGFGAFAQEIRTTEQGPTKEIVQNTPLTVRGYKILPEEGDIALGIDLNFIGNYFYNAVTGNATEHPGYSIYVKYFLKDNQAVRARLGMNIRMDNYSGSVQNDYAAKSQQMMDTYNGQTVIDIRNNGLTQWNLDLGYEFRRGYRRIQGYYGGEIGFMYRNEKDNYSYGNPISSGNNNPSTYDFNGNVQNSATGYMARVLDAKYGKQFGFRAGAFIGVEYFIGSRLSLGAEFGLGIGVMHQKQTETTTEYWDPSVAQVVQNTVRSYDGDNKSGSAYFSTNARGSIYAMFHF